MKKSMNFYAPIWLLVLGLAFGLISCQKEGIESEDGFLLYEHPTNSATYGIVITNLEYQNIIHNKPSDPYDMNYIHFVMHDGTIVKDFEYVFNYTYHHPSARGCNFRSKFLGQMIKSGDYYEEYWKTDYMDKEFYLILSEEDTDTLLWNSSEGKLYHNGKQAPHNITIMKNIN